MALVPGSTAGPYRIVEPLGRGGMASVYKAYEAALDRYVALKVLPREFLHDPDFARRFDTEAKAIASLEHPNIVPIYAYDIDREEGIPWMAMRLVAGGALSSLIRRERLPFARAVAILRGMADALDYAHRKGIVHRDVKPPNVLLDDDGRVYLADFGIAKILESTAGVTATGMITGTPQYMAPEQATAKKIGPAADVYALGIVAYEMFTGAKPFDADTPLAVMMKHVQDPLPIPPASTLPEPLLRPLLKCTAKRPEDRWPSAGAFVSALEGALAPSTAVIADVPTIAVGPPATPPAARTAVSPRTEVPERTRPARPSADTRAAQPSEPTRPAQPLEPPAPTIVAPPPVHAARSVPGPTAQREGRSSTVLLGGGAAVLVLLLIAGGAAFLLLRSPAPAPAPSEPPAPLARQEPAAEPASAASSGRQAAATAPPSATAPSATAPRETPFTPSRSSLPTAPPPTLARARDTATTPSTTTAPAPPTPVPAPTVDPQIAQLAAALGEGDPASRWRAAQALGSYRGEAAPAVGALASALADRSAEVRWRSAEALGLIGGPAAPAVPALARALSDADPLVRTEATKALGLLGSASGPAVAPLAQGLGSPDVSIRRESARALGRVGPAAAPAVSALIAALSDKDKFVRMESARALGRVGPSAREATSALNVAARDPELLVSREARTALDAIAK